MHKSKFSKTKTSWNYRKGSLGQGFSVAVGMALGYRYDKKNNSQIYCLLGKNDLLKI